MAVESDFTSDGLTDSSTTIIDTAQEILQNMSQYQNMTATVKIPPTIFEELGVNSSNDSLRRVSISTFTQRSLFQSSNDYELLNQSNVTLGSIVVAVRVNDSASAEDTKLSTPIEVHFRLLHEVCGEHGMIIVTL